MNVILGIDTGGTYTDGVLIQHDSKEVLRGAKAFTTRENLSVGIQNCIDNLNIREDEHICLVSLSTTLATNAIVEKRNSSVGLITVGADFQQRFPVLSNINVKGKLSISGSELAPLSKEEIVDALNSMKNHIDALAVSGYASVRNPAQELYIKKLAEKILDVPVVCAHELTSALGFYKRTVTAALNANLLPIIRELIHDTKVALRKRNIVSPVCMVKGDGNLMIDSYAEKYPVETILSGPAASAIGGKFLTGTEDAIVVDMGGTTTDVVFLDGGEVVMAEEGASAGGFTTSVKAVKVNTFGIGGDSYLQISPRKKFCFGPKKVIPLCVAAAENPLLYEEIERYKDTIDKEHIFVGRQETDCFRLLKSNKVGEKELNEKEKKLLALLKDGPHSVLYLSERIGIDVDSPCIQKLTDMELIQMISMTPTDILHATGEYRAWNHKASLLGAELLSIRFGSSVDAFLQSAEEQFIDQICSAVLQSSFFADGLRQDEECRELEGLITNHVLRQSGNQHFNCKFQLTRPLIGLGAPAATWISKAAKVIDSELILPNYDAVANAVGAAAGNVRETLKALICFDPHMSQYIAYVPKERKLFYSLDEAKAFSRHALESCAKNLSGRLGIEYYEIKISEKDHYVKNVFRSDETFIKTEVSAFISGDVKIHHS